MIYHIAKGVDVTTLKTMLVKYKLTQLLASYVLLKTLKTMLVKYKY